MAFYFCEAMGRVVSMAFFYSLRCSMFEKSRPKRGIYGKCIRPRQRLEKREQSNRLLAGGQAWTLRFNFEGGES